MVRVEALLECLGLNCELLLCCGLSTIPGNVGSEPRVPHVVDMAVDHVAEFRRGRKCIEEVVVDLPVVDHVGSRVLAMRLKGFLKNLPSPLVATVDEGTVVHHDVFNISCSVDVPSRVLCCDDIVFVVVLIENEPSLPRVVVVAVLFVRLLFVGCEFNGGICCSLPFEVIWDREGFVRVGILSTEELPSCDDGGGGFVPNADRVYCPSWGFQSAFQACPSWDFQAGNTFRCLLRGFQRNFVCSSWSFQMGMGAGLPTRLLGQEWGDVGEARFETAEQQVIHLVDDFVRGHEIPESSWWSVKLGQFPDHWSGMIDCDLSELTWVTSPSCPVEGCDSLSLPPQCLESLWVNTVPKITRVASCNTRHATKRRVSWRRQRRRRGGWLHRRFHCRETGNCMG